MWLSGFVTSDLKHSSSFSADKKNVLEGCFNYATPGNNELQFFLIHRLITDLIDFAHFYSDDRRTSK